MGNKDQHDGDFTSKGFGLPPLEPVSKMPPVKKPARPEEGSAIGGKGEGKNS